MSPNDWIAAGQQDKSFNKGLHGKDKESSMEAIKMNLSSIYQGFIGMELSTIREFVMDISVWQSHQYTEPQRGNTDLKN